MRTPLPDSFLGAPLAHRGYHNRADRRPENSRAAIEAAIAAGYGIEIDLQLSKDGVAMVFHDERLERLTETIGLLSGFTADALGRIQLRDSDECIPTLIEALDIVAGRAPLLIEIKDQTDAMAPTDGRLEAATATALEGYRGPVALMSFNPHSIAHMARVAPHLPRGLTTSAFDPVEWAPLPEATCAHLRAIPDYDATLSSFISHEAKDLGAPRVAELRAQGAAILCWTIKSAEAEAKARHYAQNITFEQYPALSPRSDGTS